MADAFYDAGPLKQVAVNLFYGWGYNFYRKENQLRTDDLLIRSKVSGLLGQARVSLEAAEADYRRDFIPPPSRQHPFPSPEAVKNAQAIEKLAKDIGAVSAQIEAQPVPENDFIMRRLRAEAPTLEALLEYDHRLVGQAELLRGMLNGRDGLWVVDNVGAIRGGLQAIGETLRARQNVLLIR